MNITAPSKQQACAGLADLIRRYGVQLHNDPSRLRGLLNDFCPTCRQENVVLVSAAHKRLVEQLLCQSAETPLDVLKLRLARDFHEITATDERLALWGMETWAYALGLTDESPGSTGFQPDAPLQSDSVERTVTGFPDETFRDLAQQARAQKQPGQEAELHRRLLEWNPGCLESHLRLSEISILRQERLNAAEQAWGDRKLRRAISIVQDLQKSFPQDQEISLRLKEMQTIAMSIEEAIRTEIPECKRTRSYWRMSEVVTRLEGFQVSVPGLVQVRQWINRRLQSIDPIVNAAKAAFAQRQFERTVRLCQQISVRVTDDAESEAIRAAAEQAIEAFHRQEDAIKTAFTSQQWGQAAALLKAVEPADRQRPPFSKLWASLQAKRARALAYWRQALFVSLGAGLWIFTGKTAQIASCGVERLLSETGLRAAISGEPGDFFAPSLTLLQTKLPAVLPLLLHGLISSFLLGFLTAMLIGWNGVKRIPLMWGMQLTGGVLMVATALLLGSSADRLDQPLKLLLSSIVGGMMIGVLRRELDADSRRAVLTSALGGLAGAVVFAGGSVMHQHFPSTIPIEMMLAGGLFIGVTSALGLVSRIAHFALVPIVLGLCYALKAGMPDSDWGSWFFLFPGVLAPAAMLPFCRRPDPECRLQRCFCWDKSLPGLQEC